MSTYASNFPDIRFSWQAMCTSTNRYFAGQSFNFDDSAVDEYLAIAHLNVIPAMAAQFPIRDVVKTEHFLTTADYENLDIYNLFFRPRDELNASRGLWAYREGSNAAFLGVDIPKRYSIEDRRKLDESLATILPHLQGAFSLMLDLDVRRSRQEQAALWLETLPSAAFIVSSDGRVSRNNGAAVRLCAMECGLSITARGQLVCGSPETREALEPRLRQAALTLEPQGPFAIPCPPNVRLSGYCVPLPTGAQSDAVMSFFGGAERETLLIVVNAYDVPPRDADAISVLLGISSAEAQIVSQLCAGGDLREAAEALGVSYNTARNQMASAAERLGMRRQTELVAASVSALMQLHGLPGTRKGNHS